MGRDIWVITQREFYGHRVHVSEVRCYIAVGETWIESRQLYSLDELYIKLRYEKKATSYITVPNQECKSSFINCRPSFFVLSAPVKSGGVSGWHDRATVHKFSNTEVRWQLNCLKYHMLEVSGHILSCLFYPRQNYFIRAITILELFRMPPLHKRNQPVKV